LAIDRHYSTFDLLTSALQAAHTPRDRRHPLEQALVDQALERLPELDPSQALPWKRPRRVIFALIGLVLAAAAVLWKPAGTAPRPVAFAATSPLPPVQAVAPDDMALLTEIAQQLTQAAHDAASRQASRDLRHLIDDLFSGKSSQQQSFQRLAEIEYRLGAGLSRSDSVSDLIEAMAKELSKSALGSELAEAMQGQRLADAAEAARRLAQRLRRPVHPPSKAELQRLRSALAQASQVRHKAEREVERQRRELAAARKSLLTKRSGAEQPGSAHTSDPMQRELERLDRRQQALQDRSAALSKLDRALADAARELAEQLGVAAGHLDSAAQALNRLQRSLQTDQQKRQMLDQLRRMKDILRAQGKPGSRRQAQLRRFGRLARGQSETEPGGSNRSEQALVLGGPLSSASSLLDVPIPVPGSSAGDRQSRDARQQGQNPEVGASGSSAPGRGHDPRLTGASTQLAHKTVDVAAVAADTEEGTVSAEVVAGAAQRGFTGLGYRAVYRQYQSVAETLLDQEPIPAGMRSRVRRYFELIRPRD